MMRRISFDQPLNLSYPEPRREMTLPHTPVLGITHEEGRPSQGSTAVNTRPSMRWIARRGGATLTAVAAVGAISIVGAGLLLFGRGGDGQEQRLAADQYITERGSFEISVPASGELAALRQIEIRNKLDYRAVVTEIVDEGTYVKKGEVLVRFAQDELEDKIRDAGDVLNAARNDYAAAQANLDIKKSERDSAIDKAKLQIDLADLAFDAWSKGEDGTASGSQRACRASPPGRTTPPADTRAARSSHPARSQNRPPARGSTARSGPGRGNR